MKKWFSYRNSAGLLASTYGVPTDRVACLIVLGGPFSLVPVHSVGLTLIWKAVFPHAAAGNPCSWAFSLMSFIAWCGHLSDGPTILPLLYPLCFRKSHEDRWVHFACHLKAIEIGNGVGVISKYIIIFLHSRTKRVFTMWYPCTNIYQYYTKILRHYYYHTIDKTTLHSGASVFHCISSRLVSFIGNQE